jgi:hypothetical protein
LKKKKTDIRTKPVPTSTTVEEVSSGVAKAASPTKKARRCSRGRRSNQKRKKSKAKKQKKGRIGEPEQPHKAANKPHYGGKKNTQTLIKVA